MTPYYYARTIKGYVTALLDVFNNINIKRYDTSGTVIKTIHVPITFSPWSKFQQIRQENYTSEAGTKYYLQRPRIDLSLRTINFAPERTISTHEYWNWYNTSATDDMELINSFITMLNPIPYDYGFELYILCDMLDDWSQILENILPYFSPNLATPIRMKEISYLNLERDIHVLMTSNSINYINEESHEETKRLIEHTIGLTLQGYQYRPVSVMSSIIKIINSRFYIGNEPDVATSANPLADNFSTSAYYGTSGEPTSAMPVDTSSYNFSGIYDDGSVDQVYYFTSAQDI